MVLALRVAVKVRIIIWCGQAAGAGLVWAEVDHGCAVNADILPGGGSGSAFLKPDVGEPREGHLTVGAVEVLDDPVGVEAAELGPVP